MSELDTEKKYLDLCTLDGASVCKKSQNIMKVHKPRLTCIVGEEKTTHNISNIIGEIPDTKAIIK